MTPEQIATWFFALTAAHFYQFFKTVLKLREKWALWGLFAYAGIVSIIVTLIGRSHIPFPPTEPLAFMTWLGTHIGPIVALATLLYKGFGKTDATTRKFTPGLFISKFG